MRNPVLNSVHPWAPRFGVHCGHWLQDVLIEYGDLLVDWGWNGGPVRSADGSCLFYHCKSPNGSGLPHHQKGFCEKSSLAVRSSGLCFRTRPVQTAQVFSNGLVSCLQARGFLFETLAVLLGSFVPERAGLSGETDCDCP